MNSCELVSTVTAISCAIAKCVPKEDLPLISAILGQIASTLATITVQEDLLSSEKISAGSAPGSEIVVTDLPQQTEML